MRRFFCDCGKEIFFDYCRCRHCHCELGFDPLQGKLFSLVQSSFATEGLTPYKKCSHRKRPIQCNWLLSPNDSQSQCVSCRLTRTIPNLNYPINLERWRRLEAAKRRMIAQCYQLQLPIFDRQQQPNLGLVFDFLEDQRNNPNIDLEFVYSGHHQGVITLNAAEADESFTALVREQLQESYRTLLGHFRHEMGHYYWLLGIDNSDYLLPFRRLFGDERGNYQQALSGHYDQRQRYQHQSQYISHYASAHPLEDWAESFAHYLHINDTLETAAAFGFVKYTDSFEQHLISWKQFIVGFNELNRSMGIIEPYPFAMRSLAQQKLIFIDTWLKEFVKNSI